jgi:hypothetical protein
LINRTGKIAKKEDRKKDWRCEKLNNQKGEKEDSSRSLPPNPLVFSSTPWIRPMNYG